VESTLLGLVLDSSVVISAERNKQRVPQFIEAILKAHGPLDLSLSPATVAELVHGVYRARTVASGQCSFEDYARNSRSIEPGIFFGVASNDLSRTSNCTIIRQNEADDTLPLVFPPRRGRK
jgi:hypothetical protein